MIRAEMSSIMRDCNAHYSLRIRDTPRQASTFWMPDLCRRPNLTVPVLRLTVPASHSCSSPRSLSIIRLESHHSSVRTQFCWCRRRRCCHLQKKWHIPFLKATGFFFPLPGICIFLQVTERSRDSTRHDRECFWHYSITRCEAVTLHSPPFLRKNLVFLHLKEWIRLERGNMGKVDVATVWSVPFSPGPVLVVSCRGAVVGVSHAREDSLPWIFQSFVRYGSRTSSSSSSTLPSLPHPHGFFLPLLPPWFCRGPHAG